MRREGSKFALKSNHTLRSNTCVVSRRQTGFGGNCYYHSRFLHEDAYQYLSVAKGEWETNEAEVQKQVEQWQGTTGCRRSRWQACALGRAARGAIGRSCSCCRQKEVSKHTRRVLIRTDIEDALKCC